MIDKKENRGGKRPNSGRKELAEDKRKKKVTFSLSADVICFLNAHRPASQTLEKAVREYAEKLDL